MCHESASFSWSSRHHIPPLVSPLFSCMKKMSSLSGWHIILTDWLRCLIGSRAMLLSPNWALGAADERKNREDGLGEFEIRQRMLSVELTNSTDKTRHYMGFVTVEWKRGYGRSGGRWKDAGDCKWLIKVRGGLDAGDLWQCASEVVQHLLHACKENTFPFIQERVHVSEYVLGGYSFRSVLSRLMASDEKPSVKAKQFA